MKKNLCWVKNNLDIRRITKQFMLLVVGIALFLGFNIESYQMIDGVTAASRKVTSVSAPTLTVVSATPSVVNNIIQVEAGKPVTITVKATDPNGYSAYVFTGLWQSNTFYSPYLNYTPSTGSLSQRNLKLPSLPTGAQTTISGNASTLVFTWTPPSGAQPLALQFAAYNFFSTFSRTLGQTITIKVIDKGNPSFDASVSAQQTVPVAVLSKIPITVNPDTAADKVTISSLNLPKGATLSKASKVASGKWVSIMTWTPKLNQLGGNHVTFTATEFQKTGQVDFPVNFIAQDLSTPTFASTMSSLPKVIVGKKLTYKVILKPDAVTKDVLVTPTELPVGAVLSKPVLTGGQLVSTLTWTPTPDQLNTSTEVTFTAEDNIEGALPVTFKATFTVTSK